MGWGQGIGIGWPNATAGGIISFWYLFDTTPCGWTLPVPRQTGPLQNNQYSEGDFVEIPAYGQRAQLISPSLTPHKGFEPVNTVGKYTGCGI